MALGVLTEDGIQITSAPVIQDTGKGVFFFLKNKMNKKINDLVKLKNNLKAFDALQGRKLVKV